MRRPGPSSTRANVCVAKRGSSQSNAQHEDSLTWPRYEQEALVCLSNIENLDVNRRRPFHYKMENTMANTRFCF